MARPALINRELVLKTALVIADEMGLPAVTMRTVAQRLGVTPRALYRHVASKDDLLDGVVELLLTEFPATPETSPWNERLSSVARSIRNSALRHPQVFPLMLQRPAVTDESLVARGRAYAALAEAGIEETKLAQTERLVSSALLGFVLSEVAGRFRNHSRQQLDDDFDQLLLILRAVITFA